MRRIRMIKELAGNTYPGRGIILGLDATGSKAVVAYFIMGRSVNSRNRIFTQIGQGIRTEALDPAKLTDPSLIIYAPVRVLGNRTIVTNGDQTDTIQDFLADGKTFEEALAARRFEPDDPNFTPRISGLLICEDGTLRYKLSILKTADQGRSCQRFTFDYEASAPGKGHLIHTYAGDGDPLPSFGGEPREIWLAGDIGSFTAELWQSLDRENKVALFVRYIDLAGGEAETRIVNKGLE
ncbi:MAG: IMP cyclohydrolase [Peptococcaceae bacterium]|nr:IMP cyclohydrolase [Peptococcaceae bacterium]